MAGGFVDNIARFFGAQDSLPWADEATVQKCEREAGVSSPDVAKTRESLLRFTWALVHSLKSSDVQRGIGLLEDQLPVADADKREILYLLAVGHFRSADYVVSKRFVERALEVDPEFPQGKSLRKMIEEKIAADGMIGVGIAAGAVALLVGGIAAIAARK